MWTLANLFSKNNDKTGQNWGKKKNISMFLKLTKGIQQIENPLLKERKKKKPH